MEIVFKTAQSKGNNAKYTTRLPEVRGKPHSPFAVPLVVIVVDPGCNGKNLIPMHMEFRSPHFVRSGRLNS